MDTFRGWGGSALITGASGGIGHALAHRLAARGMDLILVARSGDALRILAEELRAAHRVEAMPVTCDLSTVSTAADLDARLGDLGPLGANVDLLVNNAAFGIYGPFGARGADREAEMIRLNLVAPALLTARFLPPMKERGRGVILQVASTAAFAPVPYQGSYAATKAHLVSWTHALDTELRGSGVRACVLCPGSTRTGFHAVSGSAEERERKLRQQSADDVARECLVGLDWGRRVIVTGRHNRIYAAVARMLPPAWAARAVAVAMRPRE
ncbi:SDR family oxidoreductase [bacterium]|nr:SDR family oxidoreductase [bacterium]